MKKILSICMSVLLLFAACSQDDSRDIFGNNTNGENNSGGNNNGNQGTTITPMADFSVKTQHPLTAVFTNNSQNATVYKWDFGDNETSTLQSPTHKYSGIGVYKVTLTATASNGKRSTYSQNVTIEAPTKCYFAGVTYKKLSVNNKYIRFQLVDDDIFTTTWCKSTYKLISTANLPYQFTLATPVYMNGMADDGYYVINVYYSNSNSGDGTKLAGFKFYTSEVWAQGGYPTELNWGVVDGNQISCQFIWK